MKKSGFCLYILPVFLLLFGVTANAQLPVQVPPGCTPFNQTVPGIAMDGSMCINADHSVSFDALFTYTDFQPSAFPGFVANGAMNVFVQIATGQSILISLFGGPVTYSDGVASVDVTYNTVEMILDSTGQLVSISGSITVNGVTIPADPVLLGFII